MTKLLALAAALIMVLPLTACGKENDSARPPQGTDNTNTAINNVANPGNPPPAMEQDGTRIYRNGDFMALQYKSPDLLRVDKKDISNFNFDVGISETEYYNYSVSFTNGSNEASLSFSKDGSSYDGGVEGYGEYYILEGDTISICSDKWDFTAEEVQRLKVAYRDSTKEKYTYYEYTPDGNFNDLTHFPTGAFTIFDEQGTADLKALVEKYLLEGVPLPTEYGARVYQDGSFYALQYKGWKAQQLNERESTADLFTFELYSGGGTSYPIAEVKRDGERCTATITPPEELAEQPIGEVYCQLDGDVLTVFVDDWNSQHKLFVEKLTNSAEDVSLRASIEGTDKNFPRVSSPYPEEVEGDVWLFPGNFSDSYDSIQILRTEGEDNPYTVIAELSTDNGSAYIDKGAAGKGYYYEVRGKKGDRFGVFTYVKESVIPESRWYKDGSEYARETLTPGNDKSFSGFAIYTSSGKFVFQSNGVIDKNWSGKDADGNAWDYHLAGGAGVSQGYYSADEYLNISDGALSYRANNSLLEKELDADGKQVLRESEISGSYTRCK